MKIIMERNSFSILKKVVNGIGVYDYGGGI